ncbi:hypothetical protein EV401DRAFT_2197742 [Pisolithus croceorrhizus]|nr:hypothetical protein EV401DRAFT_2197742 [Pisolithus croceorrhizus]
MSFSSVPNVLDDATHEALDKKVNNRVGRDQPAEARDVLYRAFTSLYQGKAADAFCEYLEHNNRDFQFGGGTPEYYGKFCSIVQSSGTGKSRLLYELHKKGVLVLYPVRDLIPAKILTEGYYSENDYSARCCAFFAAVFTAVTKYLSPGLASGSLADALKQWNGSMCTLCTKDREPFFKTLEDMYETYYERINRYELGVTVAKKIENEATSHFLKKQCNSRRNIRIRQIRACRGSKECLTPTMVC